MHKQQKFLYICKKKSILIRSLLHINVHINFIYCSCKHYTFGLINQKDKRCACKHIHCDSTYWDTHLCIVCFCQGFRLLTRIETNRFQTCTTCLALLFFLTCESSLPWSAMPISSCLISWQKVLGLASLMLRITCVSRAKFEEWYSVSDGVFVSEDQNTQLDLPFHFISLYEIQTRTSDKTMTGI